MIKGIEVKSKGDLKKLLKVLGSIASDSDDKVVKSFPMTKEWKKMHSELVELKDAMIANAERAMVLKKKFWNTVENELEIFSSMRINDKTWEIEILADKNDDDDEDED